MESNDISILHIASDEKFINAANYIFEKAFPHCNRFMIIHSRFNTELKYITPSENVEVVPSNRNLFKLMSARIRNYDCIMLHGLTELNSTIFLRSAEKEKFIGLLWGAELYTEKNFPDHNLKGKLTAAIHLDSPASEMKVRMRQALIRFLRLTPPMIKNATNLASKQLSFFGAPFEEEMALFKQKKLLNAKCRLIPFTYYPLEFIMKGNEDAMVAGSDILIGNSASYTNNHLEVFHLLKLLNTGERRLIVPLSYGDLLYADHIQTKGNELFGNQFRPLREFMTLERYTRELSYCGITIMNHYRQQAIGNILMMIWLGSKVYLNETNTVYHFLKRTGAIVFSIEKDLQPTNSNALQNLTLDEIQHNRAILKKTICEENVIANLKEAIQMQFKKS